MLKTIQILLLLTLTISAFAADNEFSGTFEPKLMANPEDTDDVIFKPIRDWSRFNFEEKPDPNETTVTAARIFHPGLDRTLSAVLVEVEDAKPTIFIDIDNDGVFKKSELITMKRQYKDNPYLWQTTVELSFTGKFYQSYPVYIQYFRDYKYDSMSQNERLCRQSKDAFARGMVDINGSKTLVIYGYIPAANKVSLNFGLLGVDGDGDGEVYLDSLSPELAKADDETIVFRAGQTFVSTKKVDFEKNLILMREHKAADYKRVDLKVGAVLPDFNFTDFQGKKRKLSEFRGKYLLIDIWGLWCGPCLREMPYLKAAYDRYKSRNFEILGLNTDTDYTTESVNQNLQKNGIFWTQAEIKSIKDVLKAYRVHSFPTTILLDPDGKIISLNQTDKGQLDLRGRDLLKSLDETLPN